MSEYKRMSPIRWRATPAQVERRDGWDVVLKYEKEDGGPMLVDLSHLSRWDVQDRDIAALRPAGAAIPDGVGEVLMSEGYAVNRMNRTQASVWHLGSGLPWVPDEPFVTETTDAHAFLAILGAEKQVYGLMERVCPLDLAAPGQGRPRLVQGPMLHIPCQIVPFSADAKGTAAVLIAFSRGYGQSMAEALLETGRSLGFRPGGESVFMKWLEGF